MHCVVHSEGYGCTDNLESLPLIDPTVRPGRGVFPQAHSSFTPSRIPRGTMGSMRIALISLHTSPGAVPGSGDAGGMNVVVAEAARALARHGHGVEIFTRATNETPAGERALDPHNSTGPRLIALAVGKPSLRKEELPGIATEFGARIAEYGPFDAIHGHYWLSGVAAASLAAAQAKAIGQRVTPALTLHTVAAQKNAHLALGDRPEPQARLDAEASLTGEQFIIAGSHSELAGVVAGYGTPAVGNAVIHPGVDTDLFVPAPTHRRSDSATATGTGTAAAAAAAAAAADFTITVLGRVQPLKGQLLAVEAMAALGQLDPTLAARTKLVIAGEPTPGAEDYAQALRARATESGISDRVHFLPAQSRTAAAALLTRSTLALVPSRSETFGLVALEAAASGVQTVVGAHTGLLEAAPNGVAGVHVADRDPRTWAGAIRALLNDENLRQLYAIRGRAHAEAHNWDAHATKLLRTYDSLMRD